MTKRFIEHAAMGFGGYLHTTPGETVFMVECQSCDMQREIIRETLERSIRGMDTLSDAEARLRCSGCGEKNAKLMTGFYAED